MLTCRDAAALASDAVDGALPPARRLSYWMHLALCAACRRYRAQMGLTRAALRRLAGQPASPEMPAAVREEFERLQKERSRC
jgi:anti-sigma factor RsiW